MISNFSKIIYVLMCFALLKHYIPKIYKNKGKISNCENILTNKHKNIEEEKDNCMLEDVKGNKSGCNLIQSNLIEKEKLLTDKDNNSQKKNYNSSKYIKEINLDGNEIQNQEENGEKNTQLEYNSEIFQNKCIENIEDSTDLITDLLFLLKKYKSEKKKCKQNISEYIENIKRCLIQDKQYEDTCQNYNRAIDILKNNLILHKNKKKSLGEYIEDIYLYE